MVTDEKNRPCWYVMRAYKNEKKAEEALQKYGCLKFYIPKKSASRTYHGVKTIKLVPVIPSLVFVQATREEIVEFKKYYNFIQFVMQSAISTGKPSYLTVSDSQMRNFVKVASKQEESTVFHTPEEIDTRKGKPVSIRGGSFDEVEGLFMTVKGRRNRRLVVVLDGVIAVSVDIDPDNVSAIQA